MVVGARLVAQLVAVDRRRAVGRRAGDGVGQRRRVDVTAGQGQGQGLVLIGGGRAIGQGRRVVDRLEVDLDRPTTAAGAVGHQVAEAGRAGVVRGRREPHDRAVELDRATVGVVDAGDRQRLALGVGVVGQERRHRDLQRAILGADDHVGHRHRRVVDAADHDRDPADRRVLAVADAVGEAGVAGVVDGRHEGHSAVAHRDQTAGPRRHADHGRRRAVDVGVVGEERGEVDLQPAVLGDREAVFASDRGIVDRGHGELDLAGRGVLTVVDRDHDPIRTVVVGGRGVAPAAGAAGDLPVLGPAQTDVQGLSLGVGRCHRQLERGVLGRGQRQVGDDGRLVLGMIVAAGGNREYERCPSERAHDSGSRPNAPRVDR